MLTVSIILNLCFPVLKLMTNYARIISISLEDIALKKTLAWICIVLTTAAFVLLSLVFVLRINVWIPVIMFAISLVMLMMIKRMPNNRAETSDKQIHEGAFFDTDEAFENMPAQTKTKASQQKKHKK